MEYISKKIIFQEIQKNKKIPKNDNDNVCKNNTNNKSKNIANSDFLFEKNDTIFEKVAKKNKIMF